MNEFEKLGLSPKLLTAIKKLNITIPTEIQKLSIPLAMQGKDVVGESSTGSGKTLAFGCPIIENSIANQKIQALILTPTRELAEQIKDSLIDLSSEKQLKTLPVYGGVSINKQIFDLERTEVVVATPGRLLDHLQRGTIDLSHLKVLVLDEADRMFDMGFIDDVERIIQACPIKRQTLFFSATISDRVKELANRHMRQPKIVTAKSHVDPTKLKQVYFDVTKNQKLSLLVHLLNHDTTGLAMVFCNTRRTTDFVVKNLKANKISAIAIHGGLSQNKRTKTIGLFNKAKIGVLVCTDVAARGLHIDNVSHVYNYEIPNDPTDYVHRIGRTARAGEEGKAINLLCQYDHENFSRVLDRYPFVIEREETPRFGKIVIKVSTRPNQRPNHRRGNFPRKRRRWHN